MKIEVGMYVRYKNYCDIAKIAKIVDVKLKNEYVSEDYYKFDNEDGTIESRIIKVSFDITDLIQVEDIVSLKEDIVSLKEDIDKFSQVFTLGIYEPQLLKEIKAKIESGKLILDSILTHEQFEREVYKI